MSKFNKIYEQILIKHADKMEEMKKQIINILLFAYIICFVIFMPLFLYTNNIVFLIIFLFLICLIPFIFSKIGVNYEYVKYFKQNVIKTFVKAYCETLNFIPEYGILPSIYAEGEFDPFNKYYSEDLITGKLENGYKIDMSEVYAIFKTENGSQDDKAFRGLFARIVFEKSVPTNLEIRRNELFSPKRKFYRIKVRRNIQKMVKEKIEMDSGEFERFFDVYSDNKIIAMQLLTSNIMEMLIDFKNKNKITPELTLKKNELYIRFETGRMFEASLFSKSTNYNRLKKYYNIINFKLKITENFVNSIAETEL